FLQAPQVLGAVPRVHHVEGPVALLEALLDEREEHPVLLVLTVEEGADVPGAVEDRTRQPDLLRVAHRVPPSCRGVPLPADRRRWRSATRSGSSPPPGNVSRHTTE